MIVGTSQVDITPLPGIQLVGFAVRSQPSTAVLDSLAARALYLEDGTERLLWLHVDLLAVEESLVNEIQRRLHAELGIPREHVLITATHAHSGPPAVHLTGCGDYDADYVAWLKDRLLDAVRLAMTNLEPCDLVTAEGRCTLGVDRRGQTSAHTDPRVAAVGWRRPDGTFKAVLLNYAMHGVCLWGTEISADWPGAAAQALSQALPGRPIALVCTGACGNINPPSVGVSPGQMQQWGRQVAESVLPVLLLAPILRHPDKTGTGSEQNVASSGENERCEAPVPVLSGPLLGVAATDVAIPWDNSTVSDIADYADRCLADQSGYSKFGEKHRLAVETWRQTMAQSAAAGKLSDLTVHLVAVTLGPVVFVAVNAEIFSRFGDLIRTDDGRFVYPIGCTNAVIGYLPDLAAYEEGGYEVQWACLYYNKPRPRRGSLELLAEQSRRLVRGLSSASCEGDYAAYLTTSQWYKAHGVQG
jgi:neutral ceramidase